MTDIAEDLNVSVQTVKKIAESAGTKDLAKKNKDSVLLFNNLIA